MNVSVLNFKYDIEIEKMLFCIKGDNIKFIHIDHKEICNFKTISELSKKNDILKKILLTLTNESFFNYTLRDGISSFVHYSYIKHLWIPVKNNEYSISDDGIVYKYDDSIVQLNKKLVVMFYPIASNPYSASLSRYFPENFPTLGKHLAKNAAILRVADLGGITGSFYLDSIGLKNNENNIQKLILQMANEYGISLDNIILYGASKGGSGALYHSILGGYSSVCVDPIVDDEFYFKYQNDSHMVSGVFKKNKKDKFNKVKKEMKVKNKIHIITSEYSEQVQYIKEFISTDSNLFGVFVNINNEIKTHSQVSKNSIHLTLFILNAFCFDIPIEIDFRNVS